MASAASPMRKLLNGPEQVVTEFLAGLAAPHGDLLRYEPASRIVVRVDAPLPGKVALVSGGGSGHEPLHAGYVGRGMLDAAAPVRCSPRPCRTRSWRHARRPRRRRRPPRRQELHRRRPNLRLAAEEAADDGLEVASVLIDDDVAVRDSLYTAGRGGVGATVLAEKIAGAAADRGHDLAAVAGFARRVNQRARSFGVALSSCVPGGRLGRSSTCRRARWRSASGSMASPAAWRAPWGRPGRSPDCWSGRCSRTSPAPARRCWPS